MTTETTSQADIVASQSMPTPRAVKAALQELLKLGVLDAEKKPNLYQTALMEAQQLRQLLEPFDLTIKLDDIRGLVLLSIAQQADEHETAVEPLINSEQDADDWSHPLVHRRRLTLEQSLLVAILRRHYVVHEQDAGIGASAATVTVAEVLPQLMDYLGASGSEQQDQKRTRTLLDGLKVYGIVSEINDNDQVTIRPLISHLANPESLQALLQQFIGQRARTGAGL